METNEHEAEKMRGGDPVAQLHRAYCSSSHVWLDSRRSSARGRGGRKSNINPPIFPSRRVLRPKRQYRDFDDAGNRPESAVRSYTAYHSVPVSTPRIRQDHPPYRYWQPRRGVELSFHLTHILPAPMWTPRTRSAANKAVKRPEICLQTSLDLMFRWFFNLTVVRTFDINFMSCSLYIYFWES